MKSLLIPNIPVTCLCNRIAVVRFKHGIIVILIQLSDSNFILAIIGAVLRINGFQYFSGWLPGAGSWGAF